MSIQSIVIPYDVSMQYVHRKMKKIYHEFSDWGNEIVIIFEGSGQYHYNNLSFPVSQGDVFVLRGDYIKEIEGADRMRMCSIYYREENLQRLAGTFRRLEGYQSLFVQNPLAKAYSEEERLHADADLLDELDSIIDRMVREQKLMEPGFEQVLNSSFFILITFISRAFAAREEYSSKSEDDFSRAVAYMQSHYSESPKLSQLAGIAHISERQFDRKFKEIYKMPPSQYLLQLKLGRAQALLEESHLSISSIAMECGFSDINYFSKYFRSVNHISPTMYRKAHYESLKMSELKRHCLKNPKQS